MNDTRPSPSAAAGKPPSSALLAAHAAMLASDGSHAAAHALARGLAQALRAERVAVGWLEGDRLEILGESGLEHASAEPDARVDAAMHEAIDQGAAVAAPAANDRAVKIVHAHDRLRDGGCVASVPLRTAASVVGAVTLWRRAPEPFANDELRSLEDLAALVGPVLSLMKANEKPLSTKLRRAWSGGARSHGGSRLVRGAWVGAALALAAVMLVPWQAGVGGRARVEGAVQRVLVAPADGFLAQAHVRPGESVRAGQTLIEFSQQDLLLDRARWTSQLEQHENGWAAANARRDRAQLVVNQARAAEAQAQLALVESRLARSTLVAPFDGIVVRGDLSQQLGAPVQQGAELMTLAPEGGYRLIVEIDERDIAQVRVGDHGAVTLGALPWEPLPLRIVRVTPMAVAVEGANVFEVEAELLAHRAELRPGLQGSARIETGRQPLAWSGARRLAGALRLQAWKWWG